MNHHPFVPCTREGLIWREAHRIKGLCRFTTAAGILVYKKNHEVITGEKMPVVRTR